MNQQAPDQWQQLARIWKTGDATVTAADVAALHGRQHRRLRIARGAELASSVLGFTAALWLALVSRFFWVGILTAAFSLASVYFVLRARRRAVPQGSADLMQSLNDSLGYVEWQAEQLRYGRVLNYVALFAVVMSASTQLMHWVSATPPPELLATAAAGIAVSTALAWNMTLAWQVWRRSIRLRTFRAKLVADATR
jgi:hypothetical protein